MSMESDCIYRVGDSVLEQVGPEGDRSRAMVTVEKINVIDGSITVVTSTGRVYDRYGLGHPRGKIGAAYRSITLPPETRVARGILPTGTAIAGKG